MIEEPQHHHSIHAEYRFNTVALPNPSGPRLGALNINGQ
jgi:hypothetical protein